MEEMKDILKERVKHAFHEGVVSSAIILLSATHALKKGGDVRVGLECLLRAGRNAERTNSRKVEVRHLKEVLKEVKRAKPRILKERIGEEERIILKILDEVDSLDVTQLYERYSKISKKPIARRTFRNKINELLRLGLIKARKGVRRSRIISKAYRE